MKKYGVLALMLAIVLLPAGVHAQDGNEVPLAGGYTISLPEGWEQAESEGIYTFSQGDLSIVLTLPDALASSLDLNADMDVADVLVEAYSVMSGQTLDKETDIQTYQSDQREMATHRFEKENGTVHGVSVVLEVTPGAFALMEFQAPDDQYGPAVREAFDIMESLQVSEAAAGVSAEPCQVRAAHANVDLRVGPGENRGVFTTMTAETDYGVLGKNTLPDGSLWWRLDIADTGGANELWVADVDVETSGGCDQVVDAAAPPIIFAPPPPPPPSGEGDGAQATPNPSKVPATGSWYFSLGSEFTVNCGGGESLPVSAPELDLESFTGQITASPDGTTLVLIDPSGTTVFYGSDGFYQFSVPVEDTNAIWNLYVSSPTQMSSDVVVPLGGGCTARLPIRVQYLG
jgi:hypothetical protein